MTKEQQEEDINRIKRLIYNKHDKDVRPIVLSDEFGGNHKEIVCPICEFNYVHNCGKTIAIQGGDYEASQMVRGGIIAIPMYCEQGCHFVFYIGFHKGHTLVWFVEDLFAAGYSQAYYDQKEERQESLLDNPQPK